MRTASLVPEDVQLLWADSVAARPPAFNLTEPTGQDGVMLLDVEGDLDAPAVSRWSKLVDRAITDGASGITVDLRGCRRIDLGCLSVLVVASGKLKRRGDGGINLVTTPGSPLERRVGLPPRGCPRTPRLGRRCARSATFRRPSERYCVTRQARQEPGPFRRAPTQTSPPPCRDPGGWHS